MGYERSKSIRTLDVYKRQALGTALSGAAAWLTGTFLPAIQGALSSAAAFIMANPIALVIGAVVALVALIALKGDEIQELLGKLNAWLQGIFTRDWRNTFGPVLGSILNGFLAAVRNIWNGLSRIFNGIIDFIRGVFTGDWDRAWNGVKDIFGGVFDALVGLAKAPLNLIIGLLNGAIGAINGMINGLNRMSFTCLLYTSRCV